MNHPDGKNLIGAFYQPQAVYANIGTLRTLSARDFRSGLAEVVKAGVIGDAALFRKLETASGQVLARDMQLLAWLVRRCVAVKARVVEADEREAGMRAVLNLGHTLGHGLEQLGSFEAWAHGEAVAVGMVAASRLAVEWSWLAPGDAGRIEALLSAFGLPVAAAGLRARDLRPVLARDKKMRAGKVRFVAPTGIGTTRFRWMDVDELTTALVCAVG